MSGWLDTYDSILSGQLTEPGFEETRLALHHFGRRSLRFYTARLAYEPAWQLSILAVLDKPKALRTPISAYWHEAIEARKRRAQTAVLAFQLLGEAGAPAAPDLGRLAMSATYPGRTQRALEALRYLGPEGTAELGNVALRGEPGVSAEALRLVSQMGTNAASALPPLAAAFGTNFSADPVKFYQQVVATVEDCAKYSNGPIRLRAMRTLAVCRPESLYWLSYDRNPAVRTDATNALRSAGLDEWLSRTNGWPRGTPRYSSVSERLRSRTR